MSTSEGRPVIVAGVGELVGPDPALLAAAGVAQRAGAELHLVHAYELPRRFDVEGGLELAFPEGADSYHGQVLGMLQLAAELQPAAAGAVCHVLEGSAGECILQVAARVGAELVVVGATRGSRLRRIFLGSTAQRVLRESPLPVLVARGDGPPAAGRVLVATDLTEWGAAVHEAALSRLEALLGAPREVRVVHVVPWSLLPPPAGTETVLDAARRRMAAYLEEREPRAYPVEPVLRVGTPADEIVAEAREWNAELLVVGTHARGWSARLLLGSVAEASLRDAPCAVLAIPPAREGAAPYEAAEEAARAAWAGLAAAP